MRKYLLVASGVAIVVPLFIFLSRTPVEGREKPTVIHAYFSPKGGAMKAVSEEIRRADKTLDIGMYILTAPQLARDIVTAHKRGVKVRVILDKGMTSRWSQAKNLEESGVPTWRLVLRKQKSDPSNPQFHHKFAVVDGEKVITGSLNWTVMADQRNFENLLIIRDRKLASLYTKAFEKAWKLAVEQEKD